MLILAATCDFQQCGILTSVDSNECVQPPVKLRKIRYHTGGYYWIRGSTHKWINSWLSGRTQKVVLDGQASDTAPVLSGVPQG